MTTLLAPAPGRPWAQLEAAPGETVDGLDAAALMAAYRAHGAVLLRGFDVDLPAFGRLVQRLCSGSVFNESPDRQLLDPAANIQSVNGGADAFPLHPELSREPWKPDLCAFGCLEAPVEGGETTVCDGVALAAALPAEIRASLAQERLLYVQPATPEALRFWLGTETPTDAQLARPPAGCPYRFVRAGARIMRAFTRPALHRPMFHEGPAFGNFLLFARDYLGRQGFPALSTGKPVPEAWLDAVRAAAEPLTVPVAWRRGDLLLLDNTRFMHGRRAIADVHGRLIASFFGYLKDALPDPEEPAAAPWRTGRFIPPHRAAAAGGGRVAPDV